MGQIFVPDRRIVRPRMGAVQQILLSQKIAAGGGSVAVEAVASTDGSALGSPLDINVTCSGADRGLFAGIIFHGGSATVGTVTYNGISMGAARFSGTAAADVGNAGFFLVNPASGANTLSIPITGTTDPLAVIAVSFSGVNQSTPLRTVPAAVTHSGFSDPTPSITVTASQLGDLVLDFLAGYTGTITQDGGQTLAAEIENVAAGTYHIGSSYKTAAGASTVMGWTQNAGAGSWVYGAIAIVPA